MGLWVDGSAAATPFLTRYGVARLEFHRLEPAGREARPVSEFFVAIPLQGLVYAFAMLDQLRERMIDEGLLTPQPLLEPPPRLPRQQRSPNFP